MSAHKRALITPDSAALRRLDELSAQLRATSRPDPALLKMVTRETQTQIQQAAVHSQNRQEILNTRLDEHLSKFDSRLKDLVQDTSNALIDQARDFQELAQQSAAQGQLAARTESLLIEQNEYFSSLLEQSQIKYSASLQEYSDWLQELQLQDSQNRQFRYNAQQAATHALHDAQAYLDSLLLAYPVSSEFQRLEQLLAQAQQNLAAGFAEAALSIAQQASWQLNQIHFALEHASLELTYLNSAALEKLGQINALYEANRIVNAIDLEGRTLDFPLDVDFWTGGGLFQHIQHLQNLRQYLQQPIAGMTTEDLHALLENQLPELESGVADLVAEARHNILASQLRFNMAEAVLEALGEQGFVPSQANYIQGDMRQAYQVSMHNVEGSQLVVTLAPKASGMEHQLDLVSRDSQPRTPYEYRQRARELARSLHRAGLEVRPSNYQSLREAREEYHSTSKYPPVSSRTSPFNPLKVKLRKESANPN